jgi:hypothetical protein
VRGVRRPGTDDVFAMRRPARSMDAAAIGDGHIALGTLLVLCEQWNGDMHVLWWVGVRLVIALSTPMP